MVPGKGGGNTGAPVPEVGSGGGRTGLFVVVCRGGGGIGKDWLTGTVVALTGSGGGNTGALVFVLSGRGGAGKTGPAESLSVFGVAFGKGGGYIGIFGVVCKGVCGIVNFASVIDFS